MLQDGHSVRKVVELDAKGKVEKGKSESAKMCSSLRRKLFTYNIGDLWKRWLVGRLKRLKMLSAATPHLRAYLSDLRYLVGVGNKVNAQYLDSRA